MCFKSFESMANLTVVRDFELEKKIEEWRRLDKVGSFKDWSPNDSDPSIVTLTFAEVMDMLTYAPSFLVLQCYDTFSFSLVQWESTLAELESLVNIGDVKELRQRLSSRMNFGTAGWYGRINCSLFVGPLVLHD